MYVKQVARSQPGALRFAARDIFAYDANRKQNDFVFAGMLQKGAAFILLSSPSRALGYGGYMIVLASMGVVRINIYGSIVA